MCVLQNLKLNIVSKLLIQLRKTTLMKNILSSYSCFANFPYLFSIDLLKAF